MQKISIGDTEPETTRETRHDSRDVQSSEGKRRGETKVMFITRDLTQRDPSKIYENTMDGVVKFRDTFR